MPSPRRQARPEQKQAIQPHYTERNKTVTTYKKRAEADPTEVNFICFVFVFFHSTVEFRQAMLSELLLSVALILSTAVID
jgi:hypothetical protein